jgi:hypothetical protein
MDTRYRFLDVLHAALLRIKHHFVPAKSGANLLIRMAAKLTDTICHANTN